VSAGAEQRCVWFTGVAVSATRRGIPEQKFVFRVTAGSSKRFSSHSHSALARALNSACFPRSSLKQFYVKNVQLLQPCHALAFYFYDLLFDFFSCILQLSYFHFPVSAIFSVPLGIFPPWFSKGSVLSALPRSVYSLLLILLFPRRYPATCKQTTWVCFAVQTGLWSFTPASLTCLVCL